MTEDFRNRVVPTHGHCSDRSGKETFQTPHEDRSKEAGYGSTLQKFDVGVEYLSPIGASADTDQNRGRILRRGKNALDLASEITHISEPRPMTGRQSELFGGGQHRGIPVDEDLVVHLV